MKPAVGGFVEPKVILKKKRKDYVLGDVNERDYVLLKQAYFLTDPETFVCFGKHYLKLKFLKLITEEMQITYEGRALVKFLLAHKKEQ